MHLPSAGMIRFRFDGFASLHLSRSGHPEVAVKIAAGDPGASPKSLEPLAGQG